MQRTTWTTVLGALIGAVIGLFVGALCAVLAGALMLFFALETDLPSGWFAHLLQPAAFWIAAGGLGGALIGRRVSRRIVATSEEPPSRPV